MGQFYSLGLSDSLLENVRAVAATNKPLETLSEKQNKIKMHLDPVIPSEVEKKFKNRDDKDIDNDGDIDDSDRYLHKRRKAITRAIKRREAMQKDEVDTVPEKESTENDHQ